jgi:hypothetical protein
LQRSNVGSGQAEIAMMRCLKSLYERVIKKKKPVFTCFIDIGKAYDSADRQLEWKILRHRGALAKLVALLADLHNVAHCAMKADASQALTIASRWTLLSSKGM